MSSSQGEYSYVSPLDRQTFSLPASLSSAPIFSEETHPGFATSVYTFAGTAADCPQEFPIGLADADRIIDPSTNFELLTSSHVFPFPGDFQGDASIAAGIDQPSWEDPPHAPRTCINGGTFIGGNVNHIQRSGDSGLHILYRAAAGDATHDSEDRFPQPRCHPETRKKMLDMLLNWTSGTQPPTTGIFEDDEDEANSTSSDGPSSPILWLHGPAGAGKSAIAQSLCQTLEEDSRLMASFFFKRGHPSRGHAKRLFATIAYQLALHLPDLNRHISQSVEKDPSLVDKSLAIQLKRLILEPLRQMGPTPPLVVVIDGLDECEDPNIQQHILILIGRAVDKQQLPLQFLVTSRPESHIREIFSGALNGIHCHVNVTQSFDDVRKYLLDEFARIHHEHRETMVMVSYPWPSQEIVDDLVWTSSGYFIYASTVVKFIDDKNWRPTERLEVITGMKELHSGSPFAALDRLYTEILSRVHARPLVLKILAVLLARRLRPSCIDQLLELEPGDVRLALRGLHSVINIPRESESRFGSILSFHHASFHDFLQDPARAGIFCVSGHSHQTDLCFHILRALSYTHDEPSLNRHGHVSWALGENALEIMLSLEPTPGLVTMLRSFNPDFLFKDVTSGSLDMWSAGGVDRVLDWLKRSRPMPTDLIHVWEDYSFMVYCQSGWTIIVEPTAPGKCTEIRVTEEDRDNAYQILSQASPSLIRILQAMILIQLHDRKKASSYFHGVKHMIHKLLFTIHIMLDLSWDELRTMICSLRPLIGNRAEWRFIKILSIVASDSTLFPPQFDSILWDLASGSLHVFQQVLSGEMDEIILWDFLIFIGSSLFLRSCLPSPQLLRDLCFVEPMLMGEKSRSCLNYHAAQWLKTFPQPPLELIRRLEGYYWEQATIGDSMEGDWKDWKEHLKPYLDLVKPDRNVGRSN
ncbi:hypothetical protein DFH08DRAFT_1085498 [Mycena albidolilacea]|uniref:Nephrocystin 3-like N-terminal domain-containing protein n=1 Tax=Mycena albidolilacea TaxID=1033008 RepID=A0AAD7EIA2_9AGAR|nr:hypothetical protein DFH08DRAFT_1085498 [Mycena albidolilacea]